MSNAAGWWSCRRCCPKLDCSCRVVLISAQHPIVYWSGSGKLMMVLTWQVQSCLDSMRHNRLLARLTSPVHTHIPSRFSRSCWLLRSLTVPTPDFWSCSEERLLPLREEVLIDTTELCRHNLIYIHCIDLHWLIMAQEEVLRVLLRITGRKQSAYTLRQWYQQRKYIWQLFEKQTPFCSIFLLILFLFFLNCPQKIPITSAWPHTDTIILITTQNKCEITSIHQRHLRINK